MEGIELGIPLEKDIRAENQEEFLKLSVNKVIAYCYHKFKSGEWSEEKYEKAMKAWWRHNHPAPPQPEVVKNVQAVFGDLVDL